MSLLVRKIVLLVMFPALILLGVSCGTKQGQFFYGSFNAGDPRLVLASGTAGAYVISLYDLNGRLVRILGDYTAENLSPRGIVPIDYTTLAVALDGIDQIGQLDLMGIKSTLVSNANLTGNLYHMRMSSARTLFAIESNTIEAFSVDGGARVGAPLIGTTVGACVLNTPRGMDISSDGRVVVVGDGNDDLTIYTVNGSSASCFAANTSLAGTVNPFAVVAHSDGYIYVATQGDDSIYRFNGDGSGTGTVIFSNLTVVNNPTAMIELPDGTLLVASDGTNSIERIDTLGNRVGGSSFIVDGFTGLVNDMAIIPGGQ